MSSLTGDGAFDALVYGNTHQSVLNFLEEQRGTVLSNVGSITKNFFENTKSLVDEINRSEAMQWATAITRKVTHLWDDDVVTFLNDIGSIQQAKSQMRRFIMQDPEILTLFREQKIEGYYGLYEDTDSWAFKDTHYDYQRVNQGVIVETEEGWEAPTYSYELLEGDTELSLSMQRDIQMTCQRVLDFYRKGERDPTSPSNASL